jgi:pyridoxal phosphate enzyme (YggS family)
MNLEPDVLANNLRSVHERMAAAAKRSGRDPAEVTLVAVSKTQPSETIRAAYELGLQHFGENRVEEAEAKAGIPPVCILPADITWHMIGHIQSRKAQRVVSLFDFVHSVDSTKLAQRLDRMCAGRTEPMPVLLEINVSGEASKYGFEASRWGMDDAQREALWAAVADILTLPCLQVQGLMTMAPIVSDPEEARPVFVRLRKLRDALAADFVQSDWHHLSMGMTDDFEVAIEEGATLVRVGRASFDPFLPPWRK